MVTRFRQVATSSSHQPAADNHIIRPPGFRGAAFTTALAGDMARGDNRAVSTEVGIPTEWAMVRQVHGAGVVAVTSAGRAGDGDALVTLRRGLPLSVFTADCAGVVLEAEAAVAVAHAGWRGAAAGVVSETVRGLRRLLGERGRVARAALGPMIGPCCFEVGDDVAGLFPGYEASTSWGAGAVDLGAAIRDQAPGASWWSADACTCCGDGWFSHRADGAASRMAAIGWIP